MQTKQLIQFLAVANAGSISEAAERLHIAQPALSQSILTLEADLGVKLFIRHRRGVELTDAGDILLVRAQSILHQIEAAREIVREVDSNPSGNVAIALPASVAHVLVEPICRTISENYPRISLEIDEGLTGNIIKWLRAGHIDLMLDFDVEESGEFNSELLLEEDLYFYGAGLPDAETIEFSDLPKYPMLLPSSVHGMGKAIARLEREAGIELPRLPLHVAVHPVLALVKSGFGYSISPWSLINDIVDGENIKAQRIINPNAQRKVFLLQRRGQRETSAAMVVRDVVRDAVRKIHEKGLWHGKLHLKSSDV